MKAVIQRVNNASVSIENKIHSKIGSGFLILLGISPTDTQEDINWLVNKIVNLRVFNDTNDIMNLSLKSVDGEALIISQFTLMASTKKGNRPSYIAAAKPNVAIALYENFISSFENKLGKKVGTGVFGADMSITLVNNGPVTIIIDSKNKK